MRLFIGIELPSKVKELIYESTLPLRKSGKGWEQQNDYHLTLLFIGEAPPEIVPQILNRMKSIEFEAFRLTLREFRFFNRRVMYLAPEESPELMSLKKRLEDLFPEYLNPLARSFVPHVTVKRWQRYEYDDLVEKMNVHPFPLTTLEVDHLTLFHSAKDALGNKYHGLGG